MHSTEVEMYWHMRSQLPEDGKLHFDEDENWTSNTGPGVNLLAITLPEIGHVFMDHTGVNAAVMCKAFKKTQNKNQQQNNGTEINIKMHSSTNIIHSYFISKIEKNKYDCSLKTLFLPEDQLEVRHSKNIPA